MEAVQVIHTEFMYVSTQSAKFLGGLQITIYEMKKNMSINTCAIFYVHVENLRSLCAILVT